jgi:SET domain-containing protein
VLLGRGVFAGRDIPAKMVLEVSPVLVLPIENEAHIQKTQLYHYTYNWPYKQPNASHGEANSLRTPPITTQAVVFGLGSMFNHSTFQQNVGWERDLENLLITYTTLRDIKKGEELCISYGQRLTFKDTDPNPDEMTDEDVRIYTTSPALKCSFS